MTNFHKKIVFSSILVLIPFFAYANNCQQSNTLYECLSNNDANQLVLSKTTNINLGGWLSAGGNYNPNAKSGSTNNPIAFNYRANEFNLQQFNIFIEKSNNTDTGQWQIGGRFDFMFGLDSPYTQATGNWDTHLLTDSQSPYYKIALPQLYAEVFAPIGKGITAKLGHFYSIIGYESVSSPSNFFYSHTYSMKSSPFTHTGALLSYPLKDNMTLYSGAVMGADNFNQDSGSWSYLGGFNWTSDNKNTSFAASILQGGVSDTINDNRSYLSFVLQHQATEKLHIVLQHDHGFQTNAFGNNTSAAEWYSLVNYWQYDLTNTLGIGFRFEWFNDKDGFRYSAGKASYHASTLGLNWKPLKWLILRPEIRYDWADSTLKAFNLNTRNEQLVIGADFVILF